MGQKTLAVIVALTGCAICFSAGGALMSMHKVSFFTGYILRAVRLETKLFVVDIDDKSSIFCKVINKIRPGTCSSGWFDLHDVAQQFCAPAIRLVYRESCDAFQMAHLLGMGVAFALFVNMLLCVAGVLLLRSYLSGETHKKRLRMVSLSLFALGTMLVAFSVATYGAIVFPKMDEMRPKGYGVFGELAFKPNDGTGLSWGYLSLMCVVVVQVIIVALFPLVKTSQELSHDELEERKIWKQQFDDYAATSQGAPAAGMLPSPSPEQQQQFQQQWQQQQQTQPQMATQPMAGTGSYGYPAQPAMAGGYGQADYTQAGFLMQQPMQGAAYGTTAW